MKEADVREAGDRRDLSFRIMAPGDRSWFDDGEFDPGSERTLAARFKHASRANGPLRRDGSGGRVSNTWVICPGYWNSTWKHVVIPDTTACTEVRAGKGATAPTRDEPAAH